ncbi:MAG TPA: GNAT family N-acetyltransferase [Caulobacteraceae bacterium]|nr:GNAT family N-acetyltransferase [Caulobacteraceae bacterium]
MTFPPSDAERRRLSVRLLGYLRALAERRPNSERVGPFVATFDDSDANIFFNYAIPDHGARPSPGEIAALTALFQARNRKPRLEYMTDAAPGLEAALIAEGFSVEARLPTMVYTPGMGVGDASAAGFDVFNATRDEDLADAERVQAQAFGGVPQGPDGFKRAIGQGGIIVAARDRTSGVIAGAGMATPPIDGIAEVAGIGVREDFRRRGAAGAITALVTRIAFENGVTLAWLTPESTDAQRIYARAGFAVACEALHISL